MCNRFISILGRSLICGAVGAAWPLLNLIKIGKQNKNLNQDVIGIQSRLQTCQEEKDQCEQDLNEALMSINTLEKEVKELKLQKKEVEETKERLSGNTKELKDSLTTMERQLFVSRQNEELQQKTIQDFIRREQEAGSMTIGAEPREENLDLKSLVANLEKKAISTADNDLVQYGDKAKAKSAGVSETDASASHPESRLPLEHLRSVGSVENSKESRIECDESLDPESNPSKTPMRVKKRRGNRTTQRGKLSGPKSQPGRRNENVALANTSGGGKRKNATQGVRRRRKRMSVEELLDSELHEYFAREPDCRRSW
ncbi:phage tail tape measure protein [Gracilaria domingensis]|nr:phage tail tape measure protein [Gracilaria domingensis]